MSGVKNGKLLYNGEITFHYQAESFMKVAKKFAGGKQKICIPDKYSRAYFFISKVCYILLYPILWLKVGNILWSIVVISVSSEELTVLILLEHFVTSSRERSNISVYAPRISGNENHNFLKDVSLMISFETDAFQMIKILTHFWPILPFYTPRKHQKTKDFLMFSGGIRWDHLLEIS